MKKLIIFFLSEKGYILLMSNRIECARSEDIFLIQTRGTSIRITVFARR